jgi:uncharacterized protein
MKRVAVAYSGGADSTFLLKKAVDALGSANVLAVYASSELCPSSEKKEAKDFAKALNAKLKIIRIRPLKNIRIKKNPKDRCYFCKRLIFGAVKKAAKEQGTIHVIEGTNLDDLKDIRPGFRALRELGVKSPLLSSGFKKSEIREASRSEGLPTWDKPNMACLASRIPYGSDLSERALRMADEGEEVVRKAGFRQVRVRVYGKNAVIETEIRNIKALKSKILISDIKKKFKKIGFESVSVDPEGYRTGKLSKIPQKNRHKR